MANFSFMRAKFILGNPLIKPSCHFCNRLKKRAKLKKERHRFNFIKKASTEAITLYDIPRDKFYDFCSYMYGKIKSVQRRNIYNFLVLFENYFILASYSGDLITLYDVDEEYKDIYYDIKQEISDKEPEAY